MQNRSVEGVSAHTDRWISNRRHRLESTGAEYSDPRIYDLWPRSVLHHMIPCATHLPTDGSD
jgi:hypothetical protein